jgi:mRNA-degrading endonuclease toxin of MazEF toxin-antitoxin module
MHRWDVVFVKADEKDAVGHPAVLLTSDDILADHRQLRLNAVVGTKKPPAVKPHDHHVILNGADGLEFLTLVDCSLIYMVRKSSILRHVGSVTVYRRQEIQHKIRACLGLG